MGAGGKNFFEALKTSVRNGIGTVSEPERAKGGHADRPATMTQQLIDKEQGIHGNPEEDQDWQ